MADRHPAFKIPNGIDPKKDRRKSINEHAERIVEARSKAELDTLRSSVFLSFKKDVKVLVLLCNEVEYRLAHSESKPTYTHFSSPSSSALNCPTVKQCTETVPGQSADCTERVSTGTRP